MNCPHCRKPIAETPEQHADRLGRTHNLTPRQRDFCIALAAFMKEHGFAPTLKELAAALGVSKSSVYEHLGALVNKGALVVQRHRSRAINFAH